MIVACKYFVQVPWKVWLWEIDSFEELGQVQDELLRYQPLQLREGEGGQSSNRAGWNQRFSILIIHV